MGTSDFAVPSLEALDKSIHQVVAVVTVPDKPAGRGQKLTSSPIKLLAENLKYPVFQPVSLNDREFLDNIKDCFADIFVVVAFRILPEILFSIPKFGSINLHPSLLPLYRGAAPIQRAIMNCETKTGLTTFKITKRVDAGNILLQEHVLISENDTTQDLWMKCSNNGAKLLIKTIDGLMNSTLTPIKQKNEISTTAPKIKKEDCKINWTKSAIDIHNQIRALSPKPGSFTKLKSRVVKLFNSSLSLCEYPAELSKLKPGEIRIYNHHLIIGTGFGLIKINEIQLEGKKRMPIKEYLLGNPQIGGETFDNE